MSNGPSLLERATGGLAAVLAVAVVARVAWELLKPMVPLLVATVLLALILSRLLGRR